MKTKSKIFIPFFIVIFLIFGCNKSLTTIWKPDNKITASTDNAISVVDVDTEILADLVTKVIVNSELLNIEFPLKYIDRQTDFHPQKGPFLFENTDCRVIVSEKEIDRAGIAPYMDKPLYFIKLIDNKSTEKISVSNEVIDINQHNNEFVSKGNITNSQVNSTDQIVLTPENLAQILAQFSMHISLQTMPAKSADLCHGVRIKIGQKSDKVKLF